MMQLGAEDWIKYGWGLELLDKYTKGDQLYIDLTGAEVAGHKSQTPMLSGIEAVHRIVKNYPGPYTLMCSGGVDSQAMIWTWHLAGVPFEIVSVRYISDGIFFNEYDLVALSDFSRRNGFTIHFKDFDLVPFLETGLAGVSSMNDCSSPHFCTYIKMSEMVETGTVLFSGNYFDWADDNAYMSYSALGMQRYAARARSTNRALIPFFMMHDPEFAMAFTPLIRSINIPKEEVYTAAGIPIIRPEKKFNGFEKIKEHYDKYTERVRPRDKLLYANKASRRVFDMLFRYPYEGPDPCKDSAHLNILTKETTR